MVIKMAGQHQFVRLRFLDDLPKAAFHGGWRTDHGIGQGMINLRSFRFGAITRNAVNDPVFRGGG